MLELNLTKKLEKGENVALVLEKGKPLTTVRMVGTYQIAQQLLT